MDSTKIVNLIQENITHGNYGQEIISETSTTVYGRISSVTRSEWNTAGQRGIEADFRLDVYSFEYHGEKVVEVDGVRYGVYRSYVRVNEDITELYLHTVDGVTYADEDDIPEEDISTYINIYEVLSSTGIPTFYGHAPQGQTLPYIVYDLADSSNFAADNIVYQRGYDLTVSLYTARKSLRRERLIESAFEQNEIVWERGETDDLDERIYVQEYIANLIGD